jgi:hypothetical protein
MFLPVVRLSFSFKSSSLTGNVAKDFIKALLNPDQAKRPTAEEALKHHVRFFLDHICLRINLYNLVVDNSRAFQGTRSRCWFAGEL